MTELLPVRYLDALPVWGIFAISVILLLLFGEIGFRIGKRRRSTEVAESSQTGAIMGASLGLLAFMLAFSFGLAGDRFHARKQVVLDEANAIGTTWLRSQMLPAPHASQIETLLKRYVDLRIEGAKAESIEELREAVAESTEIHEKLWQHAVTLGKEFPRAVTLGLFIDSLNEVIDLHETRMTVVRYRIPPAVWTALYLIAFASTIVVGLHAGLSGGRSWLATLLLAMTLSLVLMLIIDIDRPGQTLFGVSQQSLVDLRESMEAS